jgi:NAD(P)-dependent dehydrogenase (short-subunit alcohol dehydrogenase family)
VIVGRTQETLDKAAAAFPAGATILARTTDLTAPDEVDALITSVATDVGRLDVLVNYAGGPFFGTVETVTSDQWRAPMAVNVDTVYHTSRASIRHLRDTRGRGSRGRPRQLGRELHNRRPDSGRRRPQRHLRAASHRGVTGARRAACGTASAVR